LAHPPSYLPVLRLLPGRPESRPENLEQFADLGGPVMMVPLAEVLQRLELSSEIIARVPVKASPRFRMAVRDRAGKVLYCWFWDGDTLSFSDAPDVADAALPLREITGADRFRAFLQGATD
jgi:hypothetical protein